MDDKKIVSDNSNQDQDKVEINTILPEKATPIKESVSPSSSSTVPIELPPPTPKKNNK